MVSYLYEMRIGHPLID